MNKSLIQDPVFLKNAFHNNDNMVVQYCSSICCNDVYVLLSMNDKFQQ